MFILIVPYIGTLSVVEEVYHNKDNLKRKRTFTIIVCDFVKVLSIFCID